VVHPDRLNSVAYLIPTLPSILHIFLNFMPRSQERRGQLPLSVRYVTGIREQHTACMPTGVLVFCF